jgi:hypothetical protein
MLLEPTTLNSSFTFGEDLEVLDFSELLLSFEGEA